MHLKKLKIDKNIITRLRKLEKQFTNNEICVVSVSCEKVRHPTSSDGACL